jgi:hypothetical protein
MRRRVALTLGLAVLGVCVAAGSVGAGGGAVGLGEADAQVSPPGAPDATKALPQCANSVDDDGDGLVDLTDPDCTGPIDTVESGTSGAPAPTTTTSTTTTPSTTTTTPSTTTTTPSTTTTTPSTTTTTTDQEATGAADQVEGIIKPEAGTAGPAGNGGRGGGGHGEGRGDGQPGQGGHAGAGGPAGTEKPGGGDHGGAEQRDPNEPPPPRRDDGTPTTSNPGLTIADFGPAPLGVPNFIIDQFTIPPFLLPVYQACGTQYGIPWQVLASINRIETAFGTNLNVSTAGAVGWMQFLPSTWRTYGTDANHDGRKDPYNPVDAICAAARYLRAAGGEEDLRRAIFAYNHADWYVDEVLLYARQYGDLPEDLVGSLTGLTEGARFPVAADARYADDISERQAAKRSRLGQGAAGNVADVISASPTRRGIDIFARRGAPVVAVNDGVITRIGNSKRIGRYIVLRDAYGNRFTYAQLGKVANAYPVPRRDRLNASDFRLVTGGDAKPDQPASAGRQLRAPRKVSESEHGSAKANGRGDSKSGSHGDAAGDRRLAEKAGLVNTEDTDRRLFAYPKRKRNTPVAELTGQLDSLLAKGMPGYESFKGYLSDALDFDPETMDMRELKEGSQVTAGTVLGRIGKTDGFAPHVHFAIRPAGRGAPKIDPKPILDGWKLLEATAIYRAAGEDPFEGSATTGQVLLMSKPQLIQRTLSDPRLEIYSCGRQDIRSGQIDRRVLAMLEYLAERGYRLTITSLKCGHSILTSSGNVSEHSTGSAVDIAMINGIPVYGHQGPGSLADSLIRDLLRLQGTMQPHQIISLMDYFNADNTFAMSDHDDHVHVGYQPLAGPGSEPLARQFDQILKPDQWRRLIDRLSEIDNPSVPTSPSRFAVPTRRGHDEKSQKRHRASSAHYGE